PAEVADIEREELAVAQRHHVRGATPVREQSDLAEEVAAPQPYGGRFDPDLDGAGGDEVHRVAALALGDDSLARQGQPWPQQPRDLGERWRLDLGEDRRPRE